MTGVGLTLPMMSQTGIGTDGSVPEVRSAEQARKLAQDFEGLFLSMLVKEMRDTGEGEGMFPGDSSDTYGGMFDMFMGQHLAQQGGIGLADSLQQNIAEQIGRGNSGV